MFLAVSEYLLLFPLIAASDRTLLGMRKYEEPKAQHQSVRMLAQPTYPDHGPGRGFMGVGVLPHPLIMLHTIKEDRVQAI